METKAADWTKLFGKAYAKAVRMGSTGKECACCGKQTREEHFVESLEQGMFPVGPECFKKLKAAGITVLTAEEIG